MDRKCLRMRSASGSTPVISRNASDRLENRHPAAVQRLAPKAAGDPQQLRLQREIDDLRNPQFGPQQFRRQRHARELRHADRRACDQPVGLGHRRREIGASNRPPLAEARRQLGGHLLGARALSMSKIVS